VSILRVTVQSKKTFKDAVLSLLLEEVPVSQLTVQKIATRAELNRATFYLHFEDINDLLRHVTSDILDDLSKKLQPLEHSDILTEREHLTIFLDYIYEKRKLFTLLFDHKSFEARLFNLLKNLMEARRSKQQLVDSANHVSVEVRAASIMGIIMWWMKDGIHYSSEYIANQITLLNRGKI